MTLMHASLRSALTPLLAVALATALTTRAFACDCGKTSKAVATAATEHDQKESPRKHPLKGVITDVLPAQDALMVKHEAIPGVMKAMTMMFVVDPAVLKTVKKGDAITALMSRTADGDWRLDDVKVIPSAPST